MNKIVAYLVLVCLISGLVLMNSCKKDPVPPTLTTNIADITLTLLSVVV